METSPLGKTLMNSVDQLADKIAPSLKDKLDAKGFVISTIVVISALVSILVNLIRLNQMCKNTPKEALNRIKKPGLLDKIKIRKVIRAAVKDKGVKIPKGVAGDPAIALIEQAISEAASLIDEKDVQTILDAIEG